MKPLIKLFKLSNDDCYFFDTNKNEIVSITYGFYDYLEKYLKDESIQNDSKNFKYKKLFDDYVNRGYLSEHRVLEIEHPMTDYLESILSNKIESITLQVTL